MVSNGRWIRLCLSRASFAASLIRFRFRKKRKTWSLGLFALPSAIATSVFFGSASFQWVLTKIATFRA